MCRRKSTVDWSRVACHPSPEFWHDVSVSEDRTAAFFATLMKHEKLKFGSRELCYDSFPINCWHGQARRGTDERTSEAPWRCLLSVISYLDRKSLVSGRSCPCTLYTPPLFPFIKHKHTSRFHQLCCTKTSGIDSLPGVLSLARKQIISRD